MTTESAQVPRPATRIEMAMAELTEKITALGRLPISFADRLSVCLTPDEEAKKSEVPIQIKDNICRSSVPLEAELQALAEKVSTFDRALVAVLTRIAL